MFKMKRGKSMRNTIRQIVGLVVFGFSSSSFPNIVYLDNFDGATQGVASGITYSSTPNGLGAGFSIANSSRIEYPFSSGFPHQGTIEFLININSGYNYSNFTLNQNQPYARIFDTGQQDFWARGGMWLWVNDNGDIKLTTATVSGQAVGHDLSVTNTSFHFNTWNTIGFSYGSSGQQIMVNGQL